MKRIQFAVPLLCASMALAQITASEVVTLPTAATWGGGDVVGSQLIGATYNAGNGPGIWIVADGGYRLYLNGELLAQDNQAGRVRFVPLTFLPGVNAVSVMGVDGNSAPGVLVQIDELERTHVSGTSWKVSAAPTSNSWKQNSFSDAAWSAATASGSATTTPSGKALSGFAAASGAKWIWSNSTANTQVVLRYTFNIKAEGFGAATTGGASGSVVIATTPAQIKTALQSASAATILVPEGTYDFRNTRDDANGTYKWCTRQCASTDFNKNNTYLRVTFDGTCGTGETIATSVPRWDNWIPIKANKSLIGMGRGANLRGASIYMRGAESANNGIFRNLAIYDVNPHLVEANDGLSTDNTSKFWVDHVSYKWISDGMDIGGSAGTKEVTVSYLDYDGSNDKNCYGNDPYVALLEDVDVTYAHDYWHNTSGRVPKVVSTSTSSRVHIYNSYIDSNTFFIVGAHGTDATHKSEVLFESNYIKNAKGYPTMKEPYGYINSRNNTWAGVVGTHQLVDASGNRTPSVEPTDAVFTVPYAYTLDAVAGLPAANVSNAGVGGKWGSMPLYDQPAVFANKAPTVALTAPVTGATATAPATVTLSASASDADGSIAKVEFYMGTTLVGTDNSSPYSISVSNVGAGTHSIVAVATDNSGLTTTSAFVTITVTGVVNTAPTITSAATANVPENSTTVLTVTSTDPDAGATAAYSINGGLDAAKFSINGTTGALAFVTAPNFEAPTDNGANNVYDVIVQVSNGSLTATKAIAVTVTNVNEAPGITSAAALSVAENTVYTTSLMTITATDPDASTTLTYTLGGVDAARFLLSSNTKNLYFAKTPDFVVPLDNGANNVYNITVQVSDGALSATQAITITVTDVVEAVSSSSAAVSSSSVALSSSVLASSSSVVVSSSSVGVSSSSVIASSSSAAVSSSSVALSSSVLASSSSVVVSSSGMATGLVQVGAHDRAIAAYVVLDLMGRPRFHGANLSRPLPAGRWIVQAKNARGQILASWVENGSR